MKQSGGEQKRDRAVLRKSCFYNKMGAAAQEMVLEYWLRCPKRGFIALVVVKLAEIA